jgi:tyrosinase
LRQVGVDRRSFLKGAAAGAVASALAGGAMAQAPRLRPNVGAADLPDSVLATYQRAIRKMLALPPENPLNYYRQAIIHLIDCTHNNWWFLPWHRAYIRHFEAIIRKVSGDDAFMLPFWDWTGTPQIPHRLWQDVLDPRHPVYYRDFARFKADFTPALSHFWAHLSRSRRQSLQQRGIDGPAGLIGAVAQAWRPPSRRLTPAAPALQGGDARNVSPEVIGVMLDFHDPSDFMGTAAPNHDEGCCAGTFEGQPHGSIHNGVGGFMVGNLSPLDPIFWLHHANIDRLWAIWQSRQRAAGRPAYPADRRWAVEPFEFFVDENGTPVSRQAGEFAEIGTGVPPYAYDPGYGTVPAAGAGEVPFGVSEAAGGDIVQSPGLARPLAVGTVISQSLDLPPGLAVAGQALPVVATFTLSAPLPPGADFEVFLDAPDLTATTPVTVPQFAGASAVFGDHHHHHGDGPVTVSVLLTPALLAAANLGKPAGGPVTIQVRPTFRQGVSPAGTGTALGIQLLRIEVVVL